MTGEYEILAECRTYAELVTALRERLVNHTGTSFDKIELIAGIPHGYLSKLSAKRRVRGLASMSFNPLLTVGGMMVLVVVDPTTVEAAKAFAARKQVSLGRGQFDPLKNKSGTRVGLRAIKTHQNKANSEWGKQMQARWMLNTSPKDRSANARKAIRARWAKLRRELATSCA